MTASTPLPGTATPTRRRALPGLDQVALRAVVVLAAMVALVGAQLAGSRPAGWAQGAVLGLALLTAWRPDGIAGAGLLTALAWVWALGPRAGSALVLVVAAGMVLVHVATLVAAQGPAVGRVDLVQAARWLGRGVLLWLGSVAVWGLARWAEDLPLPRPAYAVGLVVLAVLAVAGTGVLGARPATTDGP